MLGVGSKEQRLKFFAYFSRWGWSSIRTCFADFGADFGSLVEILVDVKVPKFPLVFGGVGGGIEGGLAGPSFLASDCIFFGYFGENQFGLAGGFSFESS